MINLPFSVKAFRRKSVRRINIECCVAIFVMFVNQLESVLLDKC